MPDDTTPTPESSGDRIQSYALGVDDPARVAAWNTARHHVVACYCERTFHSWLFGTNPSLGGNAPAKVLRDGDTEGFLNAMWEFCND